MNLDPGEDKMRFHQRCGDRVTLTNDNTTAFRNVVEYNHGLIFSSTPLKNNILFEVVVDRRVNAWDGNLEIGVTTLDPELIELPAMASKLRNTAWMLSGNTVLRDGSVIVRSYGTETSGTPQEGERLGVMRTSKAELMFFFNGMCMGVAVKDISPNLFAVIDLYGKCVQVTITNPDNARPVIEPNPEVTSDDPNNDDSHAISEVEINTVVNRVYHMTENRNNVGADTVCEIVNGDCLRFHPRCGILVQLSANNKVAERARPLDDYNNGVVMTHRPLFNGELFEVRIEQLVNKWSGSIEVGVTTHNPTTIRFPSTMTNMDSGTIMMSGSKVLINGHGMQTEYGSFNLDELREGDTVGMMRKDTGELHYFINGYDMGVASDKVEPQVWGVVDLYGMTVKVSILDPDEVTRPVNAVAPMPVQCIPLPPGPPPPNQGRATQRLDDEILLFHSLRDSNVTLLNLGATAHRPNAFELYNNGIVMTNRTLRPNELFQVRLDLVITKWAGSIEIGVTQLSCNEIKFPFKLSNPHSATWAMSGEDVTWDGLVLIPQYVRNLSRLREGDTVGVMRKDTGTLHFFLNGVDLGPAAYEVPDRVFGIIDLYGRAAQATIVEESYVAPNANASTPESPLSTESNATLYPDLCFHRYHGRNARLARNRLSAFRATVNSEFNDAVLFSCRPLRECEIFEIQIDAMVDCWVGHLEIGVTSIKPEQLEMQDGVAGTATDLSWDTYILSGSSVMKDGQCVRKGYPLDLDKLSLGSRVGLMWYPDRSLHFFLDGIDQGKAWYVPHMTIYAVVDLYGQCTQVTIMQNEDRQFNNPTSENSLLSNPPSSLSPPHYFFSEYHGINAVLLHRFSQAKRLNVNEPGGALVFSSVMLTLGEMFEIMILACDHKFDGSLRIGVTSLNIQNVHVNRCLPLSITSMPYYTAYIAGDELRYCGKWPGSVEKVRSVTPSLSWLRPGDRIGLRKCLDDPSRIEIFLNFELLDTQIENVPDNVYAVMELYGVTTKIQVITKHAVYNTMLQPNAPSEEFTSEQSPRVPVAPMFGEPTNPNYMAAFNRAALAALASEGPGMYAVASGGFDYLSESDLYAATFGNPDNMNEFGTYGDGACGNTNENGMYATGTGVSGYMNDSCLYAPSAMYASPTGNASGNINDSGMFATASGVCGNADDSGLYAHRAMYASPSATCASPSAMGADPYGMCGLPGATVASFKGSTTPFEACELYAPECLNPPPTDAEATATVPNVPSTSGTNCANAIPPTSNKRRYPVPFSFHNIHGRNISLCSSDTVAIRKRGFNFGCAFVSQPIERGQIFRFRIDKMEEVHWYGSVGIGAVASLPTDAVPQSPMFLGLPCWVASSELMCANRSFYRCAQAYALENITENCVLTVNFLQSGDLTVEIDGRVILGLGIVPDSFSHLYPLIDLYGSVYQVSIIFHPNVIGIGASLDIPLEGMSTDDSSEDESMTHLVRGIKRRRATSQGNVRNQSPSDPQHEEQIPTTSRHTDDPTVDAPVVVRAVQTRSFLNHSFPQEDQRRSYSLEDRNFCNVPIQRSHSTHNFRMPQVDIHLVKVPIQAVRPMVDGRILGDRDDEEGEENVEEEEDNIAEEVPAEEPVEDVGVNDSNEGEGEASGGMPQPPATNDQHPELSYVYNVNIANVLRTNPLNSVPNRLQLTDQELHNIVTFIKANPGSQKIESDKGVYVTYVLDHIEVEEGEQASEWNAPEERCEHLQLALKFWNTLCKPEMNRRRQLINWGQMRCYCSTCRPDADPCMSGWARLEREQWSSGSSGEHRFLAMEPCLLELAHTEAPAALRRPTGLTPVPELTTTSSSICFDDDQKPYHVATVLDVIQGDQPCHDALAAILINVQTLAEFNRTHYGDMH